MASDALSELRRQAEAGNPGAAAYTAVLAGMGAWEPQSWPLALERLGRAAELGSASAQGQVRALSGNPDAAGDWAQAAAGIDLAPWLAAAPVQRVRGHARVLEALGFVGPEICRWLIGRAQGRLGRAQIYGVEGHGAPTEGEVRSNSAFEFAMADLDLVVLLVRAKIAATVGVPLPALENVQILHYAPGQTFEPHFDFLEPEVEGHAAEIARSGQRKATFLVYLNEGYEGGETDFPLLDFAYKGRAGDAVMFANLDAAGQPDRSMLHAGLPPTSGEKWLLSQWVRER